MNRISLSAVTLLLAAGVGAADQNEDVGKYGFRVDPMKWVQADTSLDGARARVLVFGTPKEGDQALLDAEIEKILATQQKDGSFTSEEGDKEVANRTGNRIRDLVELGIPAESPAIQRAAQFILGEGLIDEKGEPRLRRATGVGLAGLGADEATQADLKQMMAWIRGEVIGRMCPWAETLSLAAMQANREVANTEPVITALLEWAHRSMNDAGAISYKDTCSFLHFAGYSDHPLARKLAIRLVPLVLRQQEADGGFGGRSVGVLRTLKKHGLLERLRTLPPLPPDWRITRQIPAPAAGLSSMAWDGKRLWLMQKAEATLYAISPADGKVERKLQLPFKDAAGIDWGDDALLVTRGKVKELLKVDPVTGKTLQTTSLEKMEWIGDPVRVGEEVRVADPFMGCFRSVVPGGDGRLGWRGIAGAIGNRACLAGDGTWHVDSWTPMLIKSDLRGGLMDWAEKPFDVTCAGLTWDGKNLWALDAKGKRACVIEKSATGLQVTEHLAAVREAHAHVEADPFYADHGRFERGDISVHMVNTGRAPARMVLTVRGLKVCTVSPAELAADVPAGATNTVVLTMRRAASSEAGVVPSFTLGWSTEFSLRDGTTHTGRGEVACPVLPKISVRRLGVLRDLDALRDALRDLEPWTLRREGKAKVVGELRVAVAGAHLAVLARSFDPRCRPDVPEWEGCNVDLYVAKPGTAKVRQFVFLATSPKDGGCMEPYELGKKRSAADFPWRIVPIKPFGYEVHALIPLSECLLEPNAAEFLVDMAVVAPSEPNDKATFTLLFTGPASRCAFRNNRYYALAEVKHRSN